MPRDPRAYLLDVETAATEILQDFIAGVPLEAYPLDNKTRRAVERSLEIIGEALAQLRKRDPAVVTPIDQHSQIIGLRNVLIHEYGKVNDEQIWHTVQQKLPQLLHSVTAELNRIGR
jgi:uncharacterized protein with HEPN domain